MRIRLAALGCLVWAGMTPAPAAGLPDRATFTNSLGMKMVRIAPGELIMGCGQAPPRTEAEWKRRDWDEAPAHKVRITKPFFLSACEVTNAQYERFDGEHKKLRGIGGVSVGQRAAALRLASGALLLCAVDTRKPPWTHRRGTFAALSQDGGKSWAHIRHVPGVGGYLSAAQAPNGVIYLFGTRMSCVAFNECWIRQSGPVGKR